MNCDKCGKPVPSNNDATIIQSIVDKNPLIILASCARHFLPTDDCEGSPSRAQYIEGQPKDRRYPYIKKYERLYRKAYNEIKDNPS